MKILHIIKNKPDKLTKKIIDIQSKSNDVKVVELSKRKASYESIIDDIFSSDKVISW